MQEGRNTGDLSTLEDPIVLDAIKQSLRGRARLRLALLVHPPEHYLPFGLRLSKCAAEMDER